MSPGAEVEFKEDLPKGEIASNMDVKRTISVASGEYRSEVDINCGCCKPRSDPWRAVVCDC